MNFKPILDTISLRERRLLEANIINLHKTHSDIMFPIKCEKCDIIPNGLRLRNTFKSQTIALFNKGRLICDQAGRLAIKVAINNAYRKQRLLHQYICTSQQNIQQRSPHTYKETERQLDIYCNIQRKNFVERKVYKFHLICKNNIFLERSASFLLKSSTSFPKKNPLRVFYQTIQRG